jgi:predicted Rossmann-fold nucleotide-binding protein
MNRHLDIKKEFHRFSSRLDTFMTLANCVVVAPGGVGTMLEFLYSWQLIQVKLRRPIPIILLGDMWPEFIAWARRWQLHLGLLDKKDLDLIYLAKDVPAAIELIRAARLQYLRDGNGHDNSGPDNHAPQKATYG